METDWKQVYIQTMKLYIHIMESYEIIKRKEEWRNSSYTDSKKILQYTGTNTVHKCV